MNGSDTVSLCVLLSGAEIGSGAQWTPGWAGGRARSVKEKGMDLSVVVCYSSAEGEQL